MTPFSINYYDYSKNLICYLYNKVSRILQILQNRFSVTATIIKLLAVRYWDFLMYNLWIEYSPKTVHFYFVDQ